MYFDCRHKTQFTKFILSFGLLLIAMLTACDSNSEAQNSQEFSFSYNDLLYKGLVEYPQVPASALVVIIPGHGKTDFVEGKQWWELRRFFNEQGLTVVAWDRAGCGRSEGEYDHNQSVQSSAEEAHIALKEIRRLKIDGYKKIGFWGLSRGGWIVPLTIAKEQNIAFWISASGTDQYETFPYLLESNFRLAGSNEEETQILMQEWRFHVKAFRNATPYEDYIKKTSHIRQNKFLKKMGYSEPSKRAYKNMQKQYAQNPVEVDPRNGRDLVVKNFENLLSNLNVPTLALFGVLDSQVDWRGAKALYESTIGQAHPEKLTVKVFPNCNHSMMKAETGAFQEDLSKFQWQMCEGYYSTMKAWLAKHQIIE